MEMSNSDLTANSLLRTNRNFWLSLGPWLPVSVTPLLGVPLRDLVPKRLGLTTNSGSMLYADLGQECDGLLLFTERTAASALWAEPTLKNFLMRRNLLNPPLDGLHTTTLLSSKQSTFCATGSVAFFPVFCDPGASDPSSKLKVISAGIFAGPSDFIVWMLMMSSLMPVDFGFSGSSILPTTVSSVMQLSKFKRLVFGGDDSRLASSLFVFLMWIWRGSSPFPEWIHLCRN